MDTTLKHKEDTEYELCDICTEPIHIYAVSDCDHRTCHRCALRLRALYDTHHCPYCKAEQKTMIFSQESEKAYCDYAPTNTPYMDKKLNIKFESQEMYKESMDLLSTKCSACNALFEDWNKLKLHVRKDHGLHLCELCTKHKKVFPCEQTLYSSNHLVLHEAEGDSQFNKEDETGFKGHPLCAFCQIRFFSNDELFIHCRDNHEKCFLCEKKGIQHEYYVDYRRLEDHFKESHHMCLYPQCLEKKFIVFDSAIDLKGHALECHGDTISGLQRSSQVEARRLEVNFQYDSYHNRMQKSKRRVKKNGEVEEKRPVAITRVDPNAVTPEDFPDLLPNDDELPKPKPRTIPGAPSKKGKERLIVNDAPHKPEPRTIPGAPSKKGKERLLKKPAGFGALTESRVDQPAMSKNNSSNSSNTSQSSHHSEVPSSIVAAHTAFISKVEGWLKSKEKIVEFRSLTSAYRKSKITCKEYVDLVVGLCNNSIDISSKIFKGVENLLDVDEKKGELVRVWRDKHTTMSHFPVLETKFKTFQEKKPTRVLVIKSKVEPKKAAWTNDKPKAEAKKKNASITNSMIKPTPASTIASPPHSRPTSRPASPSPSSSTYSKPSRPAPANAFPSLPASTPKHRMLLNMRRTNSSQQMNNAWSSDKGSESDQSETYNNVPTMKKKGKKNQILFRVG
ncbi:hypothetical protein BDB01DRAFT_811860 [Pilobolus umbonatus]|nr:hypothetical protein BDB01DRAFT_811860 [Pilobolus umbonatus]